MSAATKPAPVPKVADIGDKLAQAQFENALVYTDAGKLKSCLANALTFLRQDPRWKGVLAYDEFHRRAVALKPPPFGGPDGPWDDRKDTLTCEWLQHSQVMVNSAVTAEAVQAIARETNFHPVRSYLAGLGWDGKPRLDTWLTFYLGVEPSAYSKAVGAKWLISAVARVKRPGCKADCVLHVEGKQGVRKSSMVHVLGDPWVLDHLSCLTSKDAQQELAGQWIVELAEMDASRKEMAAIKGFLTKLSDKYRPSYGRRVEEFPRQCVFVATTNDPTALHDESGNRRYWPVLATTIDLDLLARDKDQLWAEAVIRYEAGEKWWLDSDELNDLATVEQNKRYHTGPLDDLIMAWVDSPEAVTPEDRAKLLSTAGKIRSEEVLLYALKIKPDQFTQAKTAAISVARCLRHHGYTRRQDGTGDTRGKWFYFKNEGKQLR